MHMCTCSGLCAHIHVETRGRFLELFLRHFPSYVFETVPFTGVGPSKKTTVASQGATHFHFSSAGITGQLLRVEQVLIPVRQLLC